MQQPDHLLKGGNRVLFNLALKSWNSCHKNKKLYIKRWGQITHWFQEFSIELLCVRATREGEIMVSYQYLNFLMFVCLRKTLIIIEMFKELKDLFFVAFFLPQSNFWNRELQDRMKEPQNWKMCFICYYLSDEKKTKPSIPFLSFFFSYSSNILKYWKILTLAGEKKKKIKAPLTHDIPWYFPQLLVTLYFWPGPRNRNPQLQLLSDMWKKHMLKQLTKLWHLYFSPDCQSLRLFSMWFRMNQNNYHKSSWPHLPLLSALKMPKGKIEGNDFSMD